MANPNYIRGEILPPVPQSVEVLDRSTAPARVANDDLNIIASWLDDRFVLPGLNIRFGLDALIGWIPGIGDAVAAFASLYIVLAAWKRGASRITIARMVMNLGIEDMVGAIPVLGDLAHVAWKANRRNYNLLMRDDVAGPQERRRHTWQDFLFVTGACILLVAMFLAPFLLLAYMIKTHQPAWLFR